MPDSTPPKACVLEHEQWSALAVLWSNVAAIAENAPRLKVKFTLAELATLLRAQSYFAVLGGRDSLQTTDPLGGIRVIDYIGRDSSGDWDNEYTEHYASIEQNITDDPPTVRLVAGEGLRAHHRRDLIAYDDPADMPSTRLMEHLGVIDRMVAAIPVGPRAEFYLGFDRTLGNEPFDDQTLSVLRYSLIGLQPLAQTVALGYGLLGDCDRLTLRERETVSLLLDGLSEPAVADELGVSKGTAHQYVVSVYRKLRVRSRGELMALWIHRGARFRTASDAGSVLPALASQTKIGTR